jgi:hypothetical protein
MLKNNIDSLIYPPKVWSRSELFTTPCPIEKLPGIYSWYFKEIPPYINYANCINYNGMFLLYLGISPKAPPQNGKLPSHQTLYHRIRRHYNGNAECSTLRRTLGCLLSEKLEIELRRVGSNQSMTFGKDELKLNKWMNENAFVTWIYSDKPWILEEELISRLFLPLNLQMNKHNINYQVVSEIRRLAIQNARELPTIPRN